MTVIKRAINELIVASTSELVYRQQGKVSIDKIINFINRIWYSQRMHRRYSLKRPRTWPRSRQFVISYVGDAENKGAAYRWLHIYSVVFWVGPTWSVLCELLHLWPSRNSLMSSTSDEKLSLLHFGVPIEFGDQNLYSRFQVSVSWSMHSSGLPQPESPTTDDERDFSVT